jgi:hypothetical protein
MSMSGSLALPALRAALRNLVCGTTPAFVWKTTKPSVSIDGLEQRFIIFERHKHRQNKWSLTLEGWLEEGVADLCLVFRGLDTYDIFFSLISYNFKLYN